MKILSLNCGSSSVKFKLFDVNDNCTPLLKGKAERIGQQASLVTYTQTDGKQNQIPKDLPDHKTALQLIYKILNDQQTSGLKSLDEIRGVGHRIVHGGEQFKTPAIINDRVTSAIKQASAFAPLHGRANILGIEIFTELLHNAIHVAVFDTSAHQQMPPKAFLYGLPIRFYQKYGIRRYGFHGINHEYVARQAATILHRRIKNSKIITCHLGSGSSIAAFMNGKSVDTSMGLTPLEGTMMATRSGDIDAGVILHLIEVLGLTLSEVKDLLNTQSGLIGLCGNTDMRDIIQMAENGYAGAKIAIEVFVYRIQKYIGAYAAALGGVDVIVFTGGIGENSVQIRERILENFGYLGLKINRKENKKNAPIFSAFNSRVQVVTIPANEELVIARETQKIIARNLAKAHHD